MNIDNEKEHLSLKDIFHKINLIFFIVLKKWKLILLSSLIGGFFGYFLSLNIKPAYVAEYKFLVKDDKPTSLNTAFASSLNIDLNLIKDLKIFSSNNFIELFKSRRIIEKALLKTIRFKSKEITLADYYLKLFNSKSINKYSFFFSKNPDRNLFSKKQDSLINTIVLDIVNNKLSIEKYGDNDEILVAQMKSEIESFSINFLRSIIDVIIQDYNLIKINNINTLKSRIDILKKDTQKMINSKKYSIYDSNDLEIDLNIKILTKLNEQLEITMLNSMNDSHLIQIIDSPVRPLQDISTNKSTLVILLGIVFGSLVIIYIFINNYVINTRV